MGGFLALLAALSFSLDSILIRKGLSEKNAGNIWEIRFVSMSMTLDIFIVTAVTAETMGFYIIKDFKELSAGILLILLLSGISLSSPSRGEIISFKIIDF